MIKKNVQDAINKQINRELYSSYLYLSMSAYFESVNLSGFAHWMRAQADEEQKHAMKFYECLVDRGGRVKLLEIETPPFNWKSSLDVFEQVYKHEQHVTSLINALVELSIAEKDNAIVNLLQWFVNEQVEEEASADKIVQKLKIIKEDSPAILFLDKELGKRGSDK